MLRKHHSFRYVASRISQIYFQRKNPSAPWLTKQSICLLDSLILKNDVGLEFGSGRSTKWLAKRCGSLYSVESDKEWFAYVSDDVSSLNNVKYYFGEIDKEDLGRSSYLDVLKELSTNSIDFILNDGKIRGTIALKTINNLKMGGLFIIDNAERYIVNNYRLPESIGNDPIKMTSDWNEFSKLTKEWRRIWTSDGVTSTLIMIKSA